MKHSPLKKVSSVQKIKLKIQKILLGIVRERDGGCVFRNYPETGRCGQGWTQADHIITRSNPILYAELDNLICSCRRHHIFWKRDNATEWSRIVREIIGEEKWKRLHRIHSDYKRGELDGRRTQKDWLEILEKLEKRQSF